MEADTKNNGITPERILKFTKTGGRGRPPAIPKENAYLLTQGMISGDTMRTVTNKYYRALGLSVIESYSREDAAIFTSGRKLKYCGVLEQIGRAATEWEKGKLNDNNFYHILYMALQLLNDGTPSKEVERRLRNLRTVLPIFEVSGQANDTTGEPES